MLLWLQVIALDGAGSDSKSSRVVYVSIFSIANCLGRLMSGYFPDKLMHRRRVARTIPLIIVTLLTLAAGMQPTVALLSSSFQKQMSMGPMCICTMRASACNGTT